jgi:hypothetical protein
MKTTGLIKNSSGANEPYQINYFGKITDAYGVIDLWDDEDIHNSLVSLVSDVYFIRLELKEANGKTISINSYAVPVRNDVVGATHAWNRSGTYQVADLTQLNYLPPVDVQLSKLASRRVGDKNVLTYRITNPTDQIVYAVELKAYTGKNRKKLVAPVLYDDNLFTLFPSESRDINISYNRSDLAGNAFVTINCYNNTIKGNDARAATNIYRYIPPGCSNNLARSKTVTGGVNPENVTSIPADGQAKADKGKTFIDSNFNSYASLSPEQGSFTVDLGKIQSFDRIMLRWNSSFSQRNVHNLRGRPDQIKVEVSDDNAAYTVVANYDNSDKGSIMTNIILPAQVKGRYVKITPTGLLGVSPAVGMVSGLSSEEGIGQSVSGIDEVPAATAFTLSAIEIYAF